MLQPLKLSAYQPVHSEMASGRCEFSPTWYNLAYGTGAGHGPLFISQRDTRCRESMGSSKSEVVSAFSNLYFRLGPSPCKRCLMFWEITWPTSRRKSPRYSSNMSKKTESNQFMLADRGMLAGKALAGCFELSATSNGWLFGMAGRWGLSEHLWDLNGHPET